MKARLIIYFCSYNDSPHFTKFMLNGKTFSISKDKRKIDLELDFNIYEQDLGKKVCDYTLLTEKENFKFGGLFEIFLGKNIGFCFIDNVGTTFELMFLSNTGDINNFIKKKYASSILDAGYSEVEIELELNQNNTKDRANLILINCLPNTFIKQNGNVLLDLEKIKTNIDCFSVKNSYQLCFQNNNFEDFAYKKIIPIEELNFKTDYENNQKDVNIFFDTILDGLKKKDTKIIKDIFLKNDMFELEMILKKKYLFGKQLLEKELGENSYVDFMYKIIFITTMKEYVENEPNIDFKRMNTIYSRLQENKKIMDNDKLLKPYEKIFLLLDIYYLDIIKENDYKIQYCHSSDFEKGSPLSHAFQFLTKFIEQLDYDSNFYYPLLLIDADKFEYKYIRNNYIKFITIYGFNMLSLEEIKTHMKNIIPNIISFSEHLDKDLSAITNFVNGSVILNKKYFERDDLIKHYTEGNNSRNNFIVSKVLLHELFGHKKSSFSKININYASIISFKNISGELQLISSNEVNKFKETNIILTSEYIDEIKGDSGYLLEFFLGKIGEKYTLSLIDNIEIKADLSVLLDPMLWHKNLTKFQEYVKLIFIIDNLYTNDLVKIDAKQNIDSQIKVMKEILCQKKMEENGDNEGQVTQNEIEMNKIINELITNNFGNFKKEKIFRAGKKRNNLYYTQTESDSKFKVKKKLFGGFGKRLFRK